MGKHWYRILILFLSLSYFGVKAQDALDSTLIDQNLQDTLIIAANNAIEVITDTLENRPNTAALYSAALPGLGQAYNKKYWKIPILYGGGLVMGYFINYNHQLYKQYNNGLFAMIDGDERTEPFDPSLSEDDYRRISDYWKRNRDLLMIGVLVLYIVNIVDAHVDAHLELFTVDDNLSFRMEPSFDQTVMQTNLYGLSLKMRFN